MKQAPAQTTAFTLWVRVDMRPNMDSFMAGASRRIDPPRLKRVAEEDGYSALQTLRAVPSLVAHSVYNDDTA